MGLVTHCKNESVQHTKMSPGAHQIPKWCASDTSQTTPAQDVTHSSAHSATAATQAALCPLLPVSNDQEMQLPLPAESTFVQNPTPAGVLCGSKLHLPDISVT